jgi:hypothetical protein
MSVARIKAAHGDQDISTALPANIFNHGSGEFKDRLNSLPFMFSHNLPGHPLFELPRLVELAKTLWILGGAKVLFHEGDASFDNRWDEIPRKSLSFIEGITKIQNSGSWVLLKSIQDDPEYKVCIDTCVAELSELTGVDLKNEITWLEGYVFIASPGAVTPHHIDHESNFLLQVHGEKGMNVCDPNDRTLLFDEEIESYYMGDLSAAAYKTSSQEKAYVFPLAPGKGVHIPSKGPHWVRNGDKYSVSFSINFCMRELDLKARIYQFNHYLRKLDYVPTPPGRSAVRDRLKIVALGRLGRGKPANKYELLRQQTKRLDSASRIIEKVLRRPAKSQLVGVEQISDRTS